MKTRTKFRILNTNIDACDYSHILNRIDNTIHNKRKKVLLVSPMTTHVLVKALHNKQMQIALNNIDILPPDSQWLRYSLKFLYNVNLKNRVYGPELMLLACNRFQGDNYHIFLYGTKTSTLIKLKNKLIRLFPNIIIAGYYSPQSNVFSSREKRMLITQLKTTKPNLVFIALGSPKQEMLTNEILPEIKKTNLNLAIVEIGAAFDFISEVKPQAPKIIGDIGLEWLFRLLHEPRRLAKRYLYYGFLFIFLILYQKLTLMKNTPQI